MLIEMVKLKASYKYDRCACNDHNYADDVINRAYITADNVRFYGNIEIQVAEFVQFPYSYNEWCKADYNKYKCKICGKIPYRIISSEEVKQKFI